MEKYGFYAGQARDQELKRLFTHIQESERNHYDALTDMMEGEIPAINVEGVSDYQPAAAYAGGAHTEDKKHDQLLCTDSITTEKYVSTSYSGDLFHFSSPEIRRALNDIAVEEQNHAELIYLYKTANDMV